MVIVGATKNGPADRADLGEGDIVLAVAGEDVTTLPEFYRAVWALGPPGVTVPLTLARKATCSRWRSNPRTASASSRSRDCTDFIKYFTK
ncbi:MAG: PDZ domain-containing protein [Caulobacteraceae bacterium]